MMVVIIVAKQCQRKSNNAPQGTQAWLETDDRRLCYTSCLLEQRACCAIKSIDGHHWLHELRDGLMAEMKRDCRGGVVYASLRCSTPATQSSSSVQYIEARRQHGFSRQKEGFRRIVQRFLVNRERI
jgi:hypothetical protein